MLKIKGKKMFTILKSQQMTADDKKDEKLPSMLAKNYVSDNLV